MTKPNLGMEFIGFSWPKDYTTDYFEILQEQEKNINHSFLQSPQLNFRKELLDWLKIVCLKTNLNILTLYLGASIMDQFMDMHDIQPYRLKSVAAGSLMLAAKFEQCGCGMSTYAKIYTVENFNEHEEIPEKTIITAIESKLMKFFGWNLMFPTVAHFMYYLLPQAVLRSEIPPCDNPSSAEREMRMEMRDLLQETLDFILYDAKALKMRPSWLAASSVIHARLKLHLMPSWPERLQKLTGYTYVTLGPALNLVFDYFRKNEDSTTPSNESGYISQDSSPLQT